MEVRNLEEWRLSVTIHEVVGLPGNIRKSDGWVVVALQNPGKPYERLSACTRQGEMTLDNVSKMESSCLPLNDTVTLNLKDLPNVKLQDQVVGNEIIPASVLTLEVRATGFSRNSIRIIGQTQAVPLTELFDKAYPLDCWVALQGGEVENLSFGEGMPVPQVHIALGIVHVNQTLDAAKQERLSAAKTRLKTSWPELKGFTAVEASTIIGLQRPDVTIKVMNFSPGLDMLMSSDVLSGDNAEVAGRMDAAADPLGRQSYNVPGLFGGLFDSPKQRELQKQIEAGQLPRAQETLVATGGDDVKPVVLIMRDARGKVRNVPRLHWIPRDPERPLRPGVVPLQPTPERQEWGQPVMGWSHHPDGRVELGGTGATWAFPQQPKQGFASVFPDIGNPLEECMRPRKDDEDVLFV